MKIDLGHDHWRLVVGHKSGESGYQHVSLGVDPLEDEGSKKIFGDKPDTRPVLTARQLEDSSFIGRISLDTLRLTEVGFIAEGVALEEESSFYPDGEYEKQIWQARRRNED